MQQVIVIGLGQLGRIFSGALLRAGCQIIPANRGDDLAALSVLHPQPALVLVAVGEADLHGVLDDLPAVWKDRVGLIQNELLPRDWQAHGIVQPTVISVWFEKKPGTDAKPLIASPAAGLRADLLVHALESIKLPARRVEDGAPLLFELVRKNVYILTTNLAGLRTGGNVGELWERHADFARQVAEEVMDIQEWLTSQRQDRALLIEGMLEAFRADPAHQCTGRSAPARLARALSHADAAGLAVPVLRGLQP